MKINVQNILVVRFTFFIYCRSNLSHCRTRFPTNSYRIPKNPNEFVRYLCVIQKKKQNKIRKFNHGRRSERYGTFEPSTFSKSGLIVSNAQEPTNERTKDLTSITQLLLRRHCVCVCNVKAEQLIDREPVEDKIVCVFKRIKIKIRQAECGNDGKCVNGVSLTFWRKYESNGSRAAHFLNDRVCYI